MRPALRLALSVSLLAAPLFAVDGDLRTSFASGGIFTAGTTAHLLSLFGAVSAPDGAVVVYGHYIDDDDGTTTASGMHWRRVTLAGVGAECNFEVPNTSFGWISDAIFDSSGDLVVVGRMSMEADSKLDFVVARFNYPACDLDENFDGDGYRTFDFGGSLTAAGTGIVQVVFINMIPTPPFVQLELDYFVAGEVGGNNVGIARLNATGSFDTDFDGDGKRVLDLGGVDRAVDMQRGPLGSLLVFGRSTAWGIGDDDYFVAAVEPLDGEMDAGFGEAGLMHLDSALDSFPDDFATEIVVTDEDRTYFTGISSHDPNSDAFVAELEADGDPRSAFSGDGWIAYSAFSGGGNSVTYGEALAVQSDDKLLVAGEAGQAAGFGPGFHVTRFLPNGFPDSTFGAAGTAKHELDVIATEPDELYSFGGIALLEGRILIAGRAQDTGINREFVVLLESSLIFADDFDSGSTGNW